MQVSEAKACVKATGTRTAISRRRSLLQSSEATLKSMPLVGSSRGSVNLKIWLKHAKRVECFWRTRLKESVNTHVILPESIMADMGEFRFASASYNYWDTHKK